MSDVQWQSAKQLWIHLVLPELPTHLCLKLSYTSLLVTLVGDSKVCGMDTLSVPHNRPDDLGLRRDWKKVEPQKFLFCQHALLFQLDDSAFPMPFLDYGAVISPEDPRRIQFPWSFMWPWIIIPLPVQRLIIQPRASFIIFFFQTLFLPQC